MSQNPKEIMTPLLNNKNLKAIAVEDEEFPRIDVYLETEDNFLLVASVEDNAETGLRLLSFSDLAADEPTSIHHIS